MKFEITYLMKNNKLEAEVVAENGFVASFNFTQFEENLYHRDPYFFSIELAGKAEKLMVSEVVADSSSLRKFEVLTSKDEMPFCKEVVE